DDLVGEVLFAGEVDGLFCGDAVSGQDDQIAEAGRLLERAAGNALALTSDELAQLLRRARSNLHFMPKRSKRVRERLADVTRPEDTDFHDFHDGSLAIETIN